MIGRCEATPIPPEILEAAQADMAAGVFAYLDFLYGAKGKDKRP